MGNILKQLNDIGEKEKRKIKEVKNIEKEIQNIVDTNKRDILFTTVMDFFDELKPYIEKQIIDKNVSLMNDNELKEYVYNNFKNEELALLLSSIDGLFSYDCGFLYISTTGGILKKFREVAKYDNSRANDGSLHLRLPWAGQSTTIKYRMGKHVKDLVEKNSDYNIEVWTVLD